MPQLRHLAIAARDPARLASFYREVFGLKTVQEGNTTILLSDGAFTLVLLKARPDQSRELYHLGFRVESVQRMQGRFEKAGMKASLPASSDSQPYAELCVADPDGNSINVSEKSFAISEGKGLAQIRHIALYTPNPRRLADFYCSVFEMREVSRSDRSSIFVSDGYFNLALLFHRSEEKLGLHHFGFHVTSTEEMQRRVEKAGVAAGIRRPDRIPYAEYRVHDPEGNGFDISEKGWAV